MAVIVGSLQFWIYIIVIPFLVLLNGLIAGLTLGLLSLDETKIQVLIKSGTIQQKIAATRIQPLRRNTHLLLATLLLGNTIINETLPILLHALVTNEWIAIAVSVILVLTFAELLPQALCTHYGLQIGSMFAWFVYILQFFSYPISWPLSKMLDLLLGHHEGALYKKGELKEFVSLHGKNHGGDLSPDEVKIVQGTLSLHGKKIEQVMTKLEYVYMIEADTLLNGDVLQSIAEVGHSRIPVYVKEKDNIIGIMLVKNLILLDDLIPTFARDLDLIKAPKMRLDYNLFDAINFFQEGASHLAVIENETGHVVGICTLEDIIEEVLMEEVLDESDQWTDNTHTTRVKRLARSERKQFVKTDAIAGPSNTYDKLSADISGMV